MTATVPASRNAPCPCGSGKRYKDCHGSIRGAAGIGLATSAAPDSGAARRMALMQEALTLQQGGDIAGAIARYEAVLEEEPHNFDALHMLGVACYQRRELDRAERLVRKAIEVNYSVQAAHNNLRLILEAARLANAEDTLCRAVLPKLARICAAPETFAASVAARAPVDVLVTARHADVADASLARVVHGAFGPANVHQARPLMPGAPACTADVSLTASVVVLYGLDEPLAYWGEPPARSTRVLVVTHDAPALVHDRLRELSNEGRCPVHVRYRDRSLADALGLPGGVLFDDGADMAPRPRVS